MNKKVAIIGDSFAHGCSYMNGYIHGESFWVDIIYKKCINIDLYLNGDPSRDTQTIIDIWIKTLPYLNKQDILIIIVPYFNRTRLPLSEEEYSNFFGTKFEIKKDKQFDIIDRFCGTDSYDKQYNLEFWEKDYSGEYLKELLSHQEIINSSRASQLNFIDIIESLKILSPKNTYIMSWDNMEYKSKHIDDKDILTKKIGIWETLGDDWNRTNGKVGFANDFHWGINMNNAVADYIIKMFNLDKKI